MFTNPSAAVRASKVALVHSCAHAHRRSAPVPLKEKVLIIRPEIWFVKVAATLFVWSNSLDRFFGYFSDHLTPPLALEVIKWLNNPTLLLKFFHFSKKMLNISHTYLTYDVLLRSLCQAGLHNSATLIYNCMKSDGKLPESKLLGFLVSSYALANRFDMSRELLAESHSNKAPVNAIVYNSLLNVLVNQKKLDDAVCLLMELMRLQRHLETFTFNIVMRGLCRAGEINEAFKFLNDMISYGCQPDIVTYNTLIHGLCINNKVDKARDLLKDVSSKTDFAPNVVSYTTIISAYCKLGKITEGTSLFDEMVESGIRPNTFTYNVLIHGVAKMGDMASAVAMHDSMFFHGCPPDVVTFTSLIDGYCRAGQVNHGMDLWHEMLARNISANLYTFSVLTNALCKSNRLQEAHDILRLLKQSEIVPQPFIYNPVIDGYCKSGNVDEANAIVLEMEEKCKPDKLTYTILIVGYCMKGRTREAIGIFYKMLEAGCSPDDITVKTLCSCLLKAGMPREAAHIRKILFENQSLGLSLERSYNENINADMPVLVY
ncbi:pentatricopeptide repeat-containing protein At2g06000 [Arachis ipaensis]|uniref:pentatricopeptide repeat-containing protein At2g06000 n=1 Tax=Arachis ipaensis TaxID=130454 RepID=UPI0007AF4174|nr:pentatricopeptide repeat-containing protein At2g06000 [Arachis ipaensis]